MSIARSLPPLLFITLLSASPLRADSWKLAVEAGELDRRDTLVAFEAPPELCGNFALHGSEGADIPLQVDEQGRGAFIEPQLARGSRKTYSVAPARKSARGIVAEREGEIVRVTAQPGNAPIFHYQTTPGPVPADVPAYFSHGAHLHPVFTPAGRVVTGNHPPDHRWHRGIWFAWTDTDFEGRRPDFWNEGKEKDGALTGEVRFAGLERIWSGPVQAGFVGRHRFIDHTSGEEKTVLAETWEVEAARVGSANMIDLVSTQTTAGETPLKLPKYHYGGLGVRGSALWDPVDQVTMLTSNGDDRKKGDGTKAKWVYLGGAMEGQPAGLAILIHPGNFRFPQPLRLNPKNPQLCVAPSADGEWAIEPGKPYVSRYRILAADGAPDSAELERQWNDYATPPRVSLTKE